MTLFDLSGRVAAILGGTSGIGKAIASGLAGAGARVAVLGRDRAKLDAARAEMADRGEVLAVRADVTDKADLRRALEEILRVCGRVDVLVNSAGAHLKKPSVEVTEDEWDQVIAANLTGTFLSCQVFGEQMIRQQRGSIINIASLGAHVALSEATAYCASKAGVLLLTKCLAVEWARHNVRVNAITPGVFSTALTATALAIPERRQRILANTPFGRFGTTDELIGAAVYLASDASGFVTGTDVAVDGGFLAWGV